MSADPRAAAVTDISYRGVQLSRFHVQGLVEQADRADKAAGIYRVSLDAAIEEAAKAFCRIHLGDVWDSITEPARDGYRDYFRDVLTAAVMGGAQ